MTHSQTKNLLFSRRRLLKSLGLSPMLLHPAPFYASSFLFGPPKESPDQGSDFSFTDVRLTPHYPAKSPLEDVLRLVPPGSDEFITERYAFEIGLQLNEWTRALETSSHDLSSLAQSLDSSLQASSFVPIESKTMRSGNGIDTVRRRFAPAVIPGRERFLHEFQGWLGPVSRIETAEFEVTGITEIASVPLLARLDIRYNIVAARGDQRREERVGSWRMEWSHDESKPVPNAWKIHRWEIGEEILSVTNGAAFVDVTSRALGGVESYTSQMLRGSDYWRTVLDGACGIDVYGNNGIAAGDYRQRWVRRSLRLPAGRTAKPALSQSRRRNF